MNLTSSDNIRPPGGSSGQQSIFSDDIFIYLRDRVMVVYGEHAGKTGIVTAIPTSKLNSWDVLLDEGGQLVSGLQSIEFRKLKDQQTTKPQVTQLAVETPSQQTDPWDKWRDKLDAYITTYTAPFNFKELRDITMFGPLFKETHEDLACMLLVAINRLSEKEKA